MRDGRLARFARSAFDHPRAATAVLLLLVLAAAGGLAQLRIDFSLTGFYGGEDAALDDLEAFRGRWGPDDDVLMVVVDATDGDLVTPAAVAAVGRIGDALLALPDVADVRSIATERLALPGVTGGALEPLAALFPLDTTGPASRAQVLARAPFVPLLLSPDGGHAAIAVRLGFSTNDLDLTVPAVRRIADVVATHDGSDGLRLAIAGLPAIRAGFIALTIRDQLIFVPTALALIALSLAVVFRRVHGVVVPGLAALLPVLLLVGAMGWLGEPIGLLNQAYFTLIPVLAVADAIHLLSRYHEERRRADRREAVIRAVRYAGLACALTTATTALALVSLVLADMPILRRFGLFAALGMVFAFVVVIGLLPLLLRFARADPPTRQADGRRLAAIGDLGVRHPVGVVTGAVALSVVLAVAAWQVEVDNRLLAGLLGPDDPIRQASERLDTSLGGTLSLEIELTGETGAFLDPWVVGTVAAFEDWAADRNGVRAVIGPGRPALAAASLTQASLALEGPDALRALYEGLGDDVDLSRLLADDYGRGRISVRVAELGGRAFATLADDVLAEARAALGPEGLRPMATGTALVAYRGVNRIAENIAESLVLVFGVVIAVFLVLFRSPRIALVAVLPNGLPLLAGIGTVGLMGLDFDPLAGVVLAFGLGIAVDDTIHVLVRVREELGTGGTLPTAIHQALAHSGRAVTVTSVVIAGGLAVNMLSAFPPLQMLGFLGALVMLTALACNLVLLPALLVLCRADAAMRPRSSPAQDGALG